MLTALYYFLQVILCSGIMMGYYWLVLRDKKFHQYNRFYLLLTAATAWIIPLIKIQWVPKPAAKVPVYEFLTVIADSNARIDASLHNRWYQLSWQSGLTLLYVVVSTVFLIILLTGIMRVWKLVRTHTITSVGDFFLILTKTAGTPFSFFSYVFWNEAVDINSTTGKQMLQHEITHVQQKHSFDKLFIQLVMIAGWFNPFFWMIKAEMSMIHEYIADKKSVEQGDTAALAAMLLTAAYPQQQFLLANPFFFSPIKRRIAMLTNQSHPKFSYLRRLVILPLLAVVVVLFAFRSKESLAKKPISLRTVIENLVDEVKSKEPLHTAVEFKLMPLQKKYTVVLNPGHGGEDPGAKAADGTTEAALVLEYAKLIKALNQNDQIEFVLTREEDITMSVGEVVNFVKNRNADLAISLHTNSVNASADIAKKISGTEIYIQPQHIATNSQSYLLANSLGNNFKHTDINFKGIKSRKEGIQFLKNSTCPAVLTELGFLTNEEELKKLKDPAYQRNLATAILNGVQDYLYQKENTFSAVSDTTILTGDSVYVIPSGKEVKIIGNPTFVSPSYKPQVFGLSKFGNSIPLDVLCIYDGKVVDRKMIEDIDPNNVGSITVLKDKASIATYGEAGKNGVIIIKSKQPKVVQGYKIEEESTGREKTLINSFESTNNNVKDFNKALYLLDGLIVDSTSFKMISPSDIHSINILNSKQGEELFGEKGKFGVIDIKTKQYLLSKSFPLSVTSIRKGFNISEIAKEFYTRNPDIKNVYWSHSPLKMHIHLHNGSVESYDLTNASSKALAEKRYGALPIPPPPPPPIPNKKLVEISLKKAEGDTTFPKKMPLSIRTVPKGKLGEEKGNEKVFTISQVPASFPGGKSAWLKYLERNLNKDIVVEKGGPPGTYTVIVSFIVNSEGFISEVKAVNDPGYGSAAEAVRLIQKGPRWKPAQQNGKNVTSRVKQPITYVVSEE
jgi:N-acetylmuramoyl-L-alanine amidase